MRGCGLFFFQTEPLKGKICSSHPFPSPADLKGTWTILDHVDIHNTPINGRTSEGWRVGQVCVEEAQIHDRMSMKKAVHHLRL